MLSYAVHSDITDKVISVTDGATIKVLNSIKTHHDVAERDQPYGTGLRDNLSRMVAGKAVFVESGKSDRYRRDLSVRCGCTLITLRVAQTLMQIMLSGLLGWHDGTGIAPMSRPPRIEGGINLLKMRLAPFSDY